MCDVCPRGARGFENRVEEGMPLSTGTTAPDFTLKAWKDGSIQAVSLSQNRGVRPTVLLFFPGAFTPPCTEEMCSLSDGGLRGMGASGADVWGISCDTVFSLGAWAKKEGIEVPLLADYEKSVIELYDVENPDLAGMGRSSARAAFVIDSEGVIRYSEQTSALGVLPDFEAIVGALKAL